MLFLSFFGDINTNDFSLRDGWRFVTAQFSA